MGRRPVAWWDGRGRRRVDGSGRRRRAVRVDRRGDGGVHRCVRGRLSVSAITTSATTPTRTSGQPSHCCRPTSRRGAAARRAPRPASARRCGCARRGPARPGRSSSSGTSSQQAAYSDQAGAAEEDQHHERHPQDDRVDVEVAGQAAGDAGDLAVAGGAAQPAEVADLSRVTRGPSGPAVGPGVRRSSAAGPGRPSVLREVSWSWLQPAARGRLGTIGDDPDPGPRGGRTSGSGRGRASWSATPAAATMDGTMTTAPPDLRTRRRPARHPRHPEP